MSQTVPAIINLQVFREVGRAQQHSTIAVRETRPSVLWVHSPAHRIGGASRKAETDVPSLVAYGRNHSYLTKTSTTFAPYSHSSSCELIPDIVRYSRDRAVGRQDAAHGVNRGVVCETPTRKRGAWGTLKPPQWLTSGARVRAKSASKSPLRGFRERRDGT